MRRRTEDALQRSVVAYLRAVLDPKSYKVAAIPNGGWRSKIEGAILKGLGVLAGMPDLIIFGACGRCWFIELKSADGRASPVQVAMREWMMLIGVPYVEARSLDDVKAALLHWKLQTREAA